MTDILSAVDHILKTAAPTVRVVELDNLNSQASVYRLESISETSTFSSVHCSGALWNSFV